MAVGESTIMQTIEGKMTFGKMAIGESTWYQSWTNLSIMSNSH